MSMYRYIKTLYLVTKRIVLRTSLFSGDSSTPLCFRIFFFAVCTIFETDNLWIGTGAGSVNFDKAWVISTISIRRKEMNSNYIINLSKLKWWINW